MRRNEDNLPERMRGRSEVTPWRQGMEMSPFSRSVFSGSPWQMMRRMQEDMDSIFGELFGGTGHHETPRSGGMQAWAPSVDVSQTDREWRIEAELPGVEKDDIQVEVTDHQLTIRAEMRQESQSGSPQDQQRDYFHRERRFGYLERTLPLPENVSEDDIRCEFRNGVLRIDIPKPEPIRQQPRRIPINTEAGAGQGAAAASASRTQPQAQPAGSTDHGMGEEAEMDDEAALAGSKGGATSSTAEKPRKRANRKSE